jgi:molybdate transport system regulatory protein
MPRPKSCLQPRLRLLSSHGNAFGPGKAELLRGIAATGSIGGAAKRMAMSYNRAWLLVQEMNRQFREPLVASVRGGESGGGARLTAAGRDVMARYARMERASLVATRAEWHNLRRQLR